MEQNINFDRMEQAAELFGSFDENIRLIEKEYHVQVVKEEKKKVALLQQCAAGTKGV